MGLGWDWQQGWFDADLSVLTWVAHDITLSKKRTDSLTQNGAENADSSHPALGKD